MQIASADKTSSTAGDAGNSSDHQNDRKALIESLCNRDSLTLRYLVVRFDGDLYRASVRQTPRSSNPMENLDDLRYQERIRKTQGKGMSKYNQSKVSGNSIPCWVTDRIFLPS